MNKIIEALSKLSMTDDQLKEVAAAVEEMLKEAKGDLEKEYETKLEAAYEELAKELKEAEKVAEGGYSEAFGVITDLRNRLETQRAEFERALEEGYEEAFQMLQSEKAKNTDLEANLYEEYDKKMHQIKEHIIDKVDEFLQLKGKEIYEQARREITNDPAMVEHKIVLNKIVENVADYISDEDYALATSAKLDEAQKSVEELKGQVRLLEARNIRIAAENTKLNEAVRHHEEVLREHTETEKKERQSKSQNATGRGERHTGPTKVIAENDDQQKQGANDGEAQTFAEGVTNDLMSQWRSLAGVKPVADKK